jgi:hypothetical protein
MKYLAVGQLKFPLADSRHNIIHWLIVVLTRLIAALFYLPLSVYLMTIGFFLSGETIKPLSPPEWFTRAEFYARQLPYSLEIKNFIFSQLNHWYQDAPVWWTMVVGLPLLVLGTSLFLIFSFNLYYSVFSKTYNQTHCFFCRK